MEYRQYIEFLHKIEKLKCHTRHSWNSEGKRESVAEHSWRLSVMALLCTDEYPELDMVKVLKMCLIHDFGEAVTGDIPCPRTWLPNSPPCTMKWTLYKLPRPSSSRLWTTWRR